jgi:TPR repeat protein
MSKVRRVRQQRGAVSSDLYSRANEAWSGGNLRSAFRLFLAAAEDGNRLAYDTIGYFYDDGVGTKVDPDAALYWYKRAHRWGSAIAANNIGVIYRDRNDRSRALAWFRRAVKGGDGEANVNIAKMYLGDKIDVEKAAYHLNQARKNASTEVGKEEAERLLRKIRKVRLSHTKR